MATLKQKKAVAKTLENLGSGSPKSQGQILREAGYSEAIAKNPQIITESKGWGELMDEHLPDADLAKVHREGLSATTKGEADFSTRHKYLDTAYKLKSKYPAQKQEVEGRFLIGHYMKCMELGIPVPEPHASKMEEIVTEIERETNRESLRLGTPKLLPSPHSSHKASQETELIVDSFLKKLSIGVMDA